MDSRATYILGFLPAISCNILIVERMQTQIARVNRQVERRITALRLTDRHRLGGPTFRVWAELSVLLLLVCFMVRAVRPERVHIHPYQSRGIAHSRFTDSSDSRIDVSSNVQSCAPSALSGQPRTLSDFLSCFQPVSIEMAPAEISHSVITPPLRAPPSFLS